PGLSKYLCAQNARGAAIFYQVNQGGRGDHAIIEPLALGIDDDWKNPIRPDLSALPPSAVVRTSTLSHGKEKKQPLWFLRADEPLDAWLPAMRHLAEVHGTDLGIIKLSLVLRLPGFYHQKGEPQRVELLSCDASRRFTIAEVVAAYPLKTNGAN